MGEVGSRPTIGSMVIADILRHDIKTVYITGFPNYVSEKQPEGVSLHEHETRKDFDFLRHLAGRCGG